MDGDRPYHHGHLRDALLDAAEAELAESGAEGFSLRRVAKRAGVSHAAPAHHFRDVRGLLTALAARGYGRLLEMQEARAATAAPDAGAQLLAYGLAYVHFARENLALFRLCFASAYPDQADPALCAVAQEAFDRMARGVAAVTGGEPYGPPEAMADAWRVWGLTHGLADLMAAGRMASVADLPAPEREALVTRLLSDLLPRR